MQVIQTSKPNKVIYNWATDLEQEALDQMKLLAEQPFVFKHAALMADAHLGCVMPIGGVLACKGIVIPYCIGSDGGCGVIAMKTSLRIDDLTEEKKRELHHSIERSTPVGFSHNDDKRQQEIYQKYGEKVDYLFEKNKNIFNTKIQVFKDIRKEVAAQLATLGGG